MYVNVYGKGNDLFGISDMLAVYYDQQGKQGKNGSGRGRAINGWC